MPAILATPQMQLAIVNNVYQNTTRDITGDVMQTVLLTMSASYINRVTDRALLGLQEFNAGRSYLYGECTVREDVLYQCSNVDGHSGAWDEDDFTAIASGGGGAAASVFNVALTNDTGNDYSGAAADLTAYETNAIYLFSFDIVPTGPSAIRVNLNSIGYVTLKNPNTSTNLPSSAIKVAAPALYEFAFTGTVMVPESKVNIRETGTTNVMTTLGDITYAEDNDGTPQRLPGNTTTTRQFLSSVGDGVNSSAPEWNDIDSETGGTLNLGAVNAVTLNLATGSSNTAVNIGTSGTNTITIGNSNSTVTILGSVLYEHVTNLTVTDKLITINKGGAAASATGTGLEFEENASITGYLKTTGGRDGFLFRAPGNAADTSFILNATSARTINVPNASGVMAITASGNIALDSAGNITLTGTIAVTNGGTGFAAYTTGDLLYASGTTTLAKLSNPANDTVLRSPTASSIPEYGKVTEAYMSLSDVTTLNVSTTQHGFVPKAPNLTTKFLRADATWANVPVFTTYSKVLYVDPLGSDSTGTRGQFDLPFLTQSAAKTAASAGDLIVVFPGSYTSSVNVAKDGVNWFYYPGATTAVTGSATLHDQSGFTTCGKIYGFGSFTTSSTGGIYTSSVTSDQMIEFDSIAATMSNPIVMGFTGPTVAYTGIIKGNSITTTSGGCITFPWGGRVLVTVDRIYTTHNSSTAHTVTFTNGGGLYTFNCGDITATHTSAYGVNAMYNGTYIFNVGSCTGYNASGTAVLLSINGTTGKVNSDGNSTVSINGYCGTLTTGSSSGTSITANQVSQFQVQGNSGGEIHKIAQSNGVTSSVSGGNWNIYFSVGIYTDNMTITGGTVNIYGTSYDSIRYGQWIINGSGAVVTIFGGIGSLTTYDSSTHYFWQLVSGTLIVKGTVKNTLNLYDAHCIRWTGGTLIIEPGAKFITGSAVAHAICCPNTTQLTTLILIGGCTNNTLDWLGTSRKQKIKYQVGSVATSTATLNDGTGGNEAFTETDTVTYNTKALLAQRVAALINASGTLDITATQDTPGTDEYFYVEADTAGNAITLSTGSANMTISGIRENHKAPSNQVGSGVWIEDADII